MRAVTYLLLHILAHICLFYFSHFSEWFPIVVLICTSLMISGVQHPFLYPQNSLLLSEDNTQAATYIREEPQPEKKQMVHLHMCTTEGEVVITELLGWRQTIKRI